MFSRTGGGLAVRAYFNALDELYPNQVDLMHAQDYIPSNCNITNIIPIPRISYFRWIKNLLSGHLHRFYPGALNYLRKNHASYSYCVINGGTYAGDLIDKIKSYNIKVIVIHHNYEAEYVKANPSIITFWGLNMKSVIKAEKNAYLKADLNLFLTQDDLNKFEKEYGCKSNKKNKLLGIFEINNLFLPKISNLSSEITLVISGALNFAQSNNGIINYFENYYTVTKQIDPKLKIIITGSNPSKEIYHLQNIHNNTIQLYANPENIYEIIKKGNLYLCPVNNGGGLKLRIMDGLKMGMPILTHQCSARGYEYFYYKPYFKIYNDSSSFRKGFTEINELIKSGKINNKLIQNDYYHSFSFESGKNRIKEIFSEVILS